MLATSVSVSAPVSVQTRQWQALASALAIELALLAAVVAWLTSQTPKMPETVVPISIDLQTPEKPSEASQPSQPAKPQTQNLQTTQTQAPKSVVPRIMPTPAVLPEIPATAVQQEPAMAAPYQTPSQAATVPHQSAVAAPLVPAIDPAPAYNAKLAAAVQAAFELPAAASALNFKGRTRIEFALHDGVASAIRVLLSSGLGAVDRAAIKAVQSATYPPPPAALQGKEGSYQIWVACF